MDLVWIIIAILFSPIATLPFTYSWVTRRGHYLNRLRNIGFQENSHGLIVKFAEPAKPIQDFFSADPEENVSSSENPGFMYAAASTTMLLPNAIIGLYKYFVYKKRMRLQKRIYSQIQLDLLRQLERDDADYLRLKDAISREFFPS